MIAWLAETALAVSLLMVMVLALRRPVARSFGAGWAYALWAVPAIRLVLPPVPTAGELPLPPVVSFIPTAAEMAAPLPAEAGPGQWLPLALALWAGGAVIFLTLQWLSYRAFLARLDGSSRPARPPVFGGIRTWISEAASGPLALGLVKRRIVLPGDFSRRYSPAERRLALEHELVHHKRGDIWWSLAAMVVLAVFWWNPIAWLAFRAFRLDQELACDAAVARAASAEERHDYARALVKSASSPGIIAVCALKPADELKRRLKMMRRHRSSRLQSAGGATALSFLAFAGLTLGTRECLPELREFAAPHPGAVRIAAAPAPLAAPAASVPATRPRDIVITARAPKAARRPRPALASAELEVAQTEPAAVSLARLLKRLPKVPSLAAPAPPAMLKLAVREPVAAGEAQVVRFRTVDGHSHEVVIIKEGRGLAPSELRKAVARAVAEARGQGRADCKCDGAAGSSAFSIDIQTIHQGD